MIYDNDNHEKNNILTILFIPKLITPQPAKNIFYETYETYETLYLQHILHLSEK